MRCSKCLRGATRIIHVVYSGWGIELDEFEFRCNEHKLLSTDHAILHNSDLKKREAKQR